MTVTRDGDVLYHWSVSTGRNSNYATPSGNYTTFRMEAEHFSREWDNAPMPHSIFFTKLGHAIHGSYDTKRLGTPASHGCVRLSPANAATLYALVQKDGLANTKVVLSGSEQVALARLHERGMPRQTARPQELTQPQYADRNVDDSGRFAAPDNTQSVYSNIFGRPRPREVFYANDGFEQQTIAPDEQRFYRGPRGF